MASKCAAQLEFTAAFAALGKRWGNVAQESNQRVGVCPEVEPSCWFVVMSTDHPVLLRCNVAVLSAHDKVILKLVMTIAIILYTVIITIIHLPVLSAVVHLMNPQSSPSEWLSLHLIFIDACVDVPTAPVGNSCWLSSYSSYPDRSYSKLKDLWSCL